MACMIFGLKRRIFLRLLLFAIFLATPIIGLEGATYYVSPTGSDSNPGTLASPWKTLAKAVSSISSGDTVYLRGGTWQDEQLNISFKNYSSTTTFKNYPGETPIIDMRNSGTGSGAKAIYLNHSDHLHIEGITVRNSGNKAINADTCDNLTIMSCTSEHSRYAGIYIANCDTFTVSYNTVKWTQCAYGDHDHDQWTSFGEECISIAEESTNGDVHHNSISHGTTANAGGEGLNIKNGSSYIYVHHNIVDQLRDDGVQGRRYCMGVDGWTHETHHIYFYKNIVKNGSWGIQYNSEEGGYTHHLYAWNNIIIHTGHNSDKHGGGIGFPRYGGSPGTCDYCYWWNNTIYDCYYGFKGEKEELGTGKNYVQNNIIYGSARADTYFSASDPNDVTFDHNLWGETDPKFVDPGSEDFYLQSDSPAIDAGIAVSEVTDDFDGVARPQYAGYDIGAYEYNGTNPSLRAIASGNPTSGPAPLIVSFTGSASGGTPPYSYRWTFGDGSSSTTQNPSHTYTSAGDYTATLTVTDSVSTTDSKSLTINVTSAPSTLNVIASANPTSGQAPLTVNFSGSASGGTPPYTYNWNFGCGCPPSSSQNPSHTYTDTGTYTATFTVTDSASHQASDSLTITVTSGTVTQQLSLSTTTGAPAPGNGGTTNPTPGTHSYSQGSSVSVRAIPNTNYRFSIWSGDVIAADAYNEQTTVLMNRDKSLSAFFCTRCGDVNGDLNISASDAQVAFDNFLGRTSNPTQCETENADVNCDGTITPGDAQAIFNKFLGKAELPSDCSGQTRAMAAGITSVQAVERSAAFLTIEDVQVNRDGYIFVPIIIDNPMSIDAFGFDLAYPSNVLTYLTLESAELTKDYEQLDANVLPHLAINQKILRVGGYKTHSDQNPSSGVLVTLVFRAIGEFEDPILLPIIATYDDIRNIATQNGIVHRNYNIQIKENKRIIRNHDF